MLALAVPFAYCPTATRAIHVPAVVEGEEGGLLSITARIAPGNGTVFTSVVPGVGMGTQVSQRTAAAEGLAGTGVNFSDCDVFFIIGDSGATTVDGPSAGLAMGIAVRAAAEGKAVRRDVAVTGTIEPGGGAGDVGGIIDKGQAAARSGMRLFVTPHQMLHENIVLRSLSNKYNFTAVEVESLQAGYAIATSKAGAAYSDNYKLEVAPIPENLPIHEMDAQELRFAAVSRKINSLLEQQAVKGSGPLAQYGSHFEKVVWRNEKVISAGYAYTGANFAFLSLVDAEFLSTPPEKLDIGEAAATVDSCLSSLPGVKPTDKNFQWVMGAEVRRAWAGDKLETIRNNARNYTYSEEKYSAVRELYYAHSWCLASKYILDEAAAMGGNAIDEGVWEGHARLSIAALEGEMKSAGISDTEAAWHLEVAKKSFGRKQYMAALFDVAYAGAMQRALSEELGEGRNGTRNASRRISDAEMGSLWGKLYQSQGNYVIAGKGGRITPDAARVLRLAAEIDAESGKMAKIAEGGEENPAPLRVVQVVSPTEKNPFALAAVSIMMVALVGMAGEFVSLKNGKRQELAGGKRRSGWNK